MPAVTCTGDVTVAPFAGVQIVTDGEAGFNVQGAAEATTANEKIRVRKVSTKRAEEGNGRNQRTSFTTDSGG